MILLIDNYDSFTYNLFQYTAELGEEVKVVRNDVISIQDIEAMNPEAIIISPGPGRPEDAGICVEAIRHFAGNIPILGICLGHQAIGTAFGASIIRAGQIKHGKTSTLRYVGEPVIEGIIKDLPIMRYHSLVIDKHSVPNDLEVTAYSEDDEEIMAVQHIRYPVYGLQFHPESIGTEAGKEIVKHYIQIMKEGESHGTIVG
ncbi:anthranilate synthase component II [Terribacillus saccharophilus]|uniref:Aminodeoxychorismate/anthranilate synthase component II n=1 Tax=Terribacillus saccharophilus TaxID=361277 RepID=A0ABX4GXC6_9BACI|nr:aminodeoxychorismate/anthranilate synthase component II [Terribacillus saccharophilus]PAD35441.1 aminodeoxychorismate/anthranilate synthase component II [Terribacillus saccharophilus]PAD96196.1 aminodeoxychorismate/anthranilate synthase component II [Terribacillus saccharophilus]PAD99469.1 aminodeoxychorismate/anthranilate synthase component II [Terribacillus saccharophilus]